MALPNSMLDFLHTAPQAKMSRDSYEFLFMCSAKNSALHIHLFYIFILTIILIVTICKIMADKFLTAIHLFPEELWRILISYLDRPTRIHLMDAFKSLDDIFGENREIWKLEAILTMECTQSALGMANSINVMRLVCKAATSALNRDLLYKRQLKAWHHFPAKELPSSLKFWNSSESPFKFENRWTGGELRWWLMRGDTLIEGAPAFKRWWEAHENDPESYNPFPTNTLNVCFMEDIVMEENFMFLNNQNGQNLEAVLNRYPHEEYDDSLQKMHLMASKFGRHIKYLKVRCSDLRRSASGDALFECLKHVLEQMSNIKELAFYGCTLTLDKIADDRSFPEKEIESLSLIGCNNPISTKLFQRYVLKARKLTFDLRIFSARATVDMQSKPFQTRELIILNDSGHHMKYWYKLAEEELSAFNFPHLVKLTIDWNTGTSAHFMRLLPLFPVLRYLELKEHPNIRFIGNPTLRHPTRPLPSLHFIVLPFRQIYSYDFLANFKYLVEVKFTSSCPKPTEWVIEFHRRESPYFPRLYEFIVTGRVYESTIWNICPTIQKIWVEWGDGNVDYYNRK